MSFDEACEGRMQPVVSVTAMLPDVHECGRVAASRRQHYCASALTVNATPSKL